MTKRDKTPDIASLLGGKARPEAPAPAAPEAEPESKQELQSIHSKQSIQSKHTRQAGLPTGWTRATFIMREDSLEQLKALAYYQRRPIKDILEEALSGYLRKAKTGEALEVYLRRQE